MCTDNYLNIIPVFCRRIGIPNSEESRDSRFSAWLINNVLSKAPRVFWVADGTPAWDVDVGTCRGREATGGKGTEGTSIRSAFRKRHPVATRVTASVAAALSSTRQVASLQVNAC